MTISVHVDLPVGTKDMGIQITMPVEDAAALIEEIANGNITPGGILSTIKDAITSKLPTNL